MGCQVDKAIDIANRLPRFWMSQEEVLEGYHERSSKEWYSQLRENI